MARRTEKTYNISVVGLSGTEKEKGSCGIGKSCLINRFMRPFADDYYTDHISVLSQSDFAGRVVNNDHFLYWGDVIKAEDGVDYTFHVVEQTEFVDDSSFQSFRIGKTDPYYKRCAICKLQSAEKLAYICKNQLGLEHEFEQRLMPEGRFNVDGFLCLFDVSRVTNRSIELQVEHSFYILSQLIKTKKPIVIATTKNDESYKPFIIEIERLVQKKELKEKGTMLIVETSAHENVNVDMAFLAVAHAIDKTISKIKNKIPCYVDAAKIMKETKESIMKSYLSLVKSHVGNDYRALWVISHRQLQSYPEFVRFIELFGTDKAGKTFKLHLKSIREDFLKYKEKWFLGKLETCLAEMLPDLCIIADRSWYAMLMWIQRQDFFSAYFMIPPGDKTWKDDSILDMNDDRLPWDLMQTQDAELVYRNHVNVLRAEKRRAEFRNQFLLLLQESSHMTPGKPLSDVSIYFLGRECYSNLPDKDRQEVYDEFQKILKERAKQDFQELLFENAELFVRFEKGSVTNEDIKEVGEKLQNEYRYKTLAKMDDDRKSMLLSHLGFIQHSSKERCPFREACAEYHIGNFLVRALSKSDNWLGMNSLGLTSGGENRLQLAIISETPLASQLQQEIMNQSVNGLHLIEGEKISIEIANFFLNSNALFCPTFSPHGFFCAYNSFPSLICIEQNLPQILASIIPPDIPTESIPFVVILGHNPNINEAELTQLREQGQALANRLGCHFVDIPSSMMVGSMRFFYRDQVGLALHTMVTSLKHKAAMGNSWQFSMTLKSELRILMCFMCGDPFNILFPLSPLLNHQLCQVSKEDKQALNLVAYLDEKKHRIEVMCSSYHEASKLLSTLFHGWILIYSAHRIASLSNLKAFALKARNVPTMILAVADTGSSSLNNDGVIHAHLINEGNMFAQSINAAYMITSPNFEHQVGTYTPFFKDCLSRKASTELSYNYGSISNSSVSEKMKNRPPAALPCKYIPQDARSDASSSADDSDHGLYKSGVGLDACTGFSNMYADNMDELYSEIPTDTVQLIQSSKTFEKNKRSRSNIANNYTEGKKKTSFAKFLKPRQNQPSLKQKPPNISNPLAPPDSIDIAEYAQPADFLDKSDQNSLYASVVGALPHGKLQKVRVPQQNVANTLECFNNNDTAYVTSVDALNNELEDKKQFMKSRSFIDTIGSSATNEDVCATEESDGESLMTFETKSTRRRSFQAKKKHSVKCQESNEDFLTEEFDKSVKFEKELESGPWKWRNIMGLNSYSSSKPSKSTKEKVSPTSAKLKKDENTRPGLEHLCQPDGKLLPLFVEKCLNYIENHGTSSEGLYRVSGSKTHVTALLEKFEEDPSIDFSSMDFPVNSVATALKTFLNEIPIPVIPQKFHKNISDAICCTNKTDQFNMVQGILNSLPKANFEVLKSIIQHIERVSQHKSETSMDKRNLTLCWWPTLMRPCIPTLDSFQLVSKPLEDFLFLLIENCSFFFPS